MKKNGRRKPKVPKQTQLQLAAARVAEMEVAVSTTEEDLVECQRAFEIAKIAYDEANRNLSDTLDLLQARRSKLDRERASVGSIMFRCSVLSVQNKSDEGLPF
jgi:hypothetical protein